MPEIHPFLVHYPIALYTSALFIEIIRIRFKNIPDFISILLVIIAAVSGLFSGLSGDIASRNAAAIPGIADTLEKHETAGNIMVWLGLIFAFILTIWKLKGKTSGVIKWFFLIVLAAGIIITGYYGGCLVENFGAGTRLIESNTGK